MKSFAQNKQDIDVLNFYDFKRNGTFIEIGANDGICLSNTYLLEKKYGWKGICVEPIPDVFLKLKQNRNCVCIEKAVYKETDSEIDFMIHSNSLLSGKPDQIIDCYKTVIGDLIKVNTITVNDLITQNNFPNNIDYISIDTEGTELDILNTIDFNKFIFGVIIIEHNYQSEKREEIRSLLTKNSYIFAKENRCDDYYVHSSLQNFIPNFEKERKFFWNLR